MALRQETVKFADASVRVAERKDGRVKISWREMGKGRSTTAMRWEDAIEAAKQKAKDLDRKTGGRVVSVDDAEIAERVRSLAGQRSPFVWLGLIEDAQRRLGDRATLAQAVDHFERSGIMLVTRAEFTVARRRFLDLYEKRPRQTELSYRGAMRSFEKAHPGIFMDEITVEHLEAWCGRNGTDGTWNRRAGFWKTFMNQCREWGMLPKGEKHAAELLKRRKEPQRIPEIFTPDQAAAALEALSPAPRLQVTFIVGSWLGPRPLAELINIEWKDFDWERDYLHLHWKATRKVMRERYVPIAPNVRTMLKPFAKAEGKISGVMHVRRISEKLREAGVVRQWTQDIMRHSYISYQLALGHGAGQVAEWAGTSEKKIRQHYRRPLRREDGEAWSRVGLTDGEPVETIGA